jgi:hypothetical protein
MRATRVAAETLCKASELLRALVYADLKYLVAMLFRLQMGHLLH